MKHAWSLFHLQDVILSIFFSLGHLAGGVALVVVALDWEDYYDLDDPPAPEENPFEGVEIHSGLVVSAVSDYYTMEWISVWYIICMEAPEE